MFCIFSRYPLPIHRFRISFSHTQASVGEQQTVEELEADLKVLQNTCRPEINLVKFFPDTCLACDVTFLFLFSRCSFVSVLRWEHEVSSRTLFGIWYVFPGVLVIREFIWLRAASFKARTLENLAATCSPWSPLPEILRYRQTRLQDAQRLRIWTFQVFIDCVFSGSSFWFLLKCLIPQLRAKAAAMGLEWGKLAVLPEVEPLPDWNTGLQVSWTFLILFFVLQSFWFSIFAICFIVWCFVLAWLSVCCWLACASKVELLREMARGWKSQGSSSGDMIPDPQTLKTQDLEPAKLQADLQALKPVSWRAGCRADCRSQKTFWSCFMFAFSVFQDFQYWNLKTLEFQDFLFEEIQLDFEGLKTSSSFSVLKDCAHSLLVYSHLCVQGVFKEEASF